MRMLILNKDNSSEFIDVIWQVDKSVKFIDEDIETLLQLSRLKDNSVCIDIVSVDEGELSTNVHLRLSERTFAELKLLINKL